jgi:hypothetical protein
MLVGDVAILPVGDIGGDNDGMGAGKEAAADTGREARGEPPWPGVAPAELAGGW